MRREADAESHRQWMQSALDPVVSRDLPLTRLRAHLSAGIQRARVEDAVKVTMRDGKVRHHLM